MSARPQRGTANNRPPPYGYRNAPDTCRWCGEKLRGRTVYYMDGSHTFRLGYDGVFCSLKCGWRLGLLAYAEGWAK